ncbi:MAG: hypothetical protein J0L75_03235 [Spirochaetes bacterium]|nr:hypothetical protein [Spirochaetota bacterium]
MPTLPTIRLGQAEVSRLIIGGNPFSGNSHVSPELDEAMRDYYTTANIKAALRECERQGVNTVQLRADMHIMRILREHWNEGGTLQWLAQTGPEFVSFQGNLRQIRQFKRNIAIYHHGSVTDGLFKAGKIDELKDRFKLMRDAGVPVGLGTHMPQVVEACEAQGWDVDFYMLSVYNLSRAERVSSAITGKANTDEPFFDEDIPLMYRAIQRTAKPCLAFKILGATRRAGSVSQVEAAFKEAYSQIKSTDAVVVGVFQRDRNEIAANAGWVRKALGVG